MSESIVDQFSALVLADRIDSIKKLIASDPPEIDIIPPGKLCRDESFLDGLPADTLEFIFRVENAGRNLHRAEFLSRASQDALLRAINFNEASSLHRAIVYGTLAVHHVLRDDPERGKVISMFGRVLRRQWEASKLDEDLNDVIYYFQKAVQYGPAEEPNRALHFDDLGNAFSVRYKINHAQDDFEEGKRSFEAAIALGHSAEPAFISGLGRLVKDRWIFEGQREPSRLDECISIFSQAVAKVTSEFRGSVSALYWHLGKAYEDRYRLSANPDDWENTRISLEKALSLVQPGTQNHLIYCYDLGMLHSVHFSKLGRITDGNRANELFRLALQKNPSNAQVMTALAENLRFRANSTGSEQDLLESTALLTIAVNLTSSDDPELPFRLGRQAHALMDRFEVCGKIEDVDQALSRVQKALDAPSLKVLDKWKYLQMLGTCFLMRFEAIEEAHDLENAFSKIQAALSTDNLSDESQAACFRELGKAFFKKYKFTKKEEHLKGSIENYKRAIEAYGSDGSALYLVYNDLGNAFSLKFERTGVWEDLNEAVKCYHDGIQMLHHCRTDETRGAEAMLLHGLANVQFQQFQRWQRSSDLDFAIACYQKCVDSTPENNTRLATRMGSLSWALQARFDLHQKLEDLKEAQLCVENALKLSIPLKPTTKAYLENRLGAAYLRSYFILKDSKFLDIAADHFQKGLAAGCKEPAFNYSVTLNLSMALMRKAEISKNQADILAAATQFVRSMFFLKEDDPDISTMSSAFADLLMILYTMTKDPRMGKTYIQLSSFVIQNKMILPETFAYMKMQTARLEYDINKNAAAARDWLKSAIKDLPEAILLGLNRSDQLRIIKKFTWLPSHAAAFSLAAGDKPVDALRLFENSRSIIWDRLLNEDASIDELEDQHPALATKFRELKAQLAQQMPQRAATDPDYSGAFARQTFHHAALSYNKALEEIRAQPGFENFLLFPDLTTSLSEYASGDGPIIIVNGTQYRSDAIIIKSDGVTTVPLPLFNFDACLEKAAELHVSLTSMGTNPEGASINFDKVLLWLWASVAEPILGGLGLLNQAQQSCGGGNLPRVWWITTGWMNIFPIHAAGDHKRALATGEPCTVIDSTVSSYVNTLTALKFARKKFASFSTAQADSSTLSTALLVKMPTTPDNFPLDNAANEVSAVSASLDDAHVASTVLDRPKRADVLSMFKGCTLAHFACHGRSNPTDPSLSLLQLQDWKQRPFDVRAILRAQKTACQLAYLSACETAVNKLVTLREEGIHLSGGFQMAGVSHVVATLWRIEDSLSVDICKAFYGNLKGNGGKLELGNSAEALRSAVLGIRNRGEDALLWGAYVHSGP